ncbi:PIN domain-containing protein [Brachyspira alvinipulli]|uniref:PIN domain-containing protein n=1 Tax=Brachyspira alvinipulli TaxID=84379 RepID=UPI000485EBF2|nr:PIN domain-containing protein [Brachyspira alvinipulli]
MKNIDKNFINSICILDTSAILHKNSIIEDSIAYFKKVIIPKIVLLELDYQKNKKIKTLQ